MSEEFDLSPRSSKRRRTHRYEKQRTTLPETVTNGDERLDEENEEGNYMTAEVFRFSTPNKNAVASKPAQSANSRRSASGGSRKKEIPSVRSKSPLSTLSSTKNSGHVTVTRSTRKQAGRVPGDADNHVGSEKENEDRSTTSGKMSNENTDAAEENGDITQTRSSGRQRKKPARYTEAQPKISPLSTKRPKTTGEVGDVAQDTVASPSLKGILTPSKRQHVRPRKSVLFSQDVDPVGEQLGFKDINSHSNSTPRRPQRQANEPLNESTKDLERSLRIPDPVILVEDSVMDSILVDDTDTEFPGLFSSDTSSSDLPLLNHSIPNEDTHLTSIKKTVLSRLTSNRNPLLTPPSHLSSQYQTLHHLLNATVSAGESNSMLLLGPRGSGKSHLLNISLANLYNEFGSDFFHTVHLSGFFQTDDRLALRDIWRQLGREMHIDEAETEDVAGSYADTMASLLSLLSHPDEMSVEETTNGALDPELLAQEALGGMKTAKSIIFILDEFDLFTTHPRQTLLYNLFDIAQSRKAPIAVIGCSTRMDVIECLEKRVKSRFSHRWLLVPGCTTFAEWEECVKDVLTVTPSGTGGKDVLHRMKGGEEQEKWMTKWNEHIMNHFLKVEDVQKLMKRHFYTTKSLPDLFTSLYPLLATLGLSQETADSTTTTTTTLAKKHMSSCYQPISNLSVLTVLTTLPALHFSLLVSATRLIAIHSLPAVNFNLVHAHYVELMARSRLQQTAHGSVAVGGSLREWTRDTCREAWEALGRWELMLAVVGQGVEGGMDGVEGEETRMWRCEVSLEEVEWGIKERFGSVEGSMTSGPGEILVKWCREV